MYLGIESSCDESAVSLFCPAKGIVYEKVHTQIELHQDYGGVVPDLASREHLVNFPLLFKELSSQYPLSEVEAIALTTGPGLAACLAIGIGWAKSLRLLYNTPIFTVNHLRGHLYSPLIPIHAENPSSFQSKLTTLFPQLHLLVSGGNTQLVEITQPGQVKILAETIDDAAGEALDKGGKLLGLPYPAGPTVEAKSAQGNPKAYQFPQAFRSSSEHRFSFSGLKTSLRYQLEKMTESEITTKMPDICASYQMAVIEALTNKTKQFCQQKKYQSIGVSGGVSNNQLLRDKCSQLAEQHKLPIYFAERRHTGDNAAMIAFAHFMEQNMTRPTDPHVSPNWRIDQIDQL